MSAVEVPFPIDPAISNLQIDWLTQTSTANFTINANNNAYKVDVESETPLLWVFRDHIGLTGTKYGCCIAQCGACTIHIDGMAKQSCSAPVSALGKRAVMTRLCVGMSVLIPCLIIEDNHVFILDQRLSISEKYRGISILHQGSVNVTGARCFPKPLRKNSPCIRSASRTIRCRLTATYWTCLRRAGSSASCCGSSGSYGSRGSRAAACCKPAFFRIPGRHMRIPWHC